VSNSKITNYVMENKYNIIIYILIGLIFVFIFVFIDDIIKKYKNIYYSMCLKLYKYLYIYNVRFRINYK
jgi:hypothetical protein